VARPIDLPTNPTSAHQIGPAGMGTFFPHARLAARTVFSEPGSSREVSSAGHDVDADIARRRPAPDRAPQSPARFFEPARNCRPGLVWFADNDLVTYFIWACEGEVDQVVGPMRRSDAWGMVQPPRPIAPLSPKSRVGKPIALLRRSVAGCAASSNAMAVSWRMQAPPPPVRQPLVSARAPARRGIPLVWRPNQ